jgi:hypothetical protein
MYLVPLSMLILTAGTILLLSLDAINLTPQRMESNRISLMPYTSFQFTQSRGINPWNAIAGSSGGVYP